MMMAKNEAWCLLFNEMVALKIASLILCDNLWRLFARENENVRAIEGHR